MFEAPTLETATPLGLTVSPTLLAGLLHLGDTYTLCGGSLTRFADVSIRLGKMPGRDRSVDAYCLMRVQQRISEVESLEVRWDQIGLARLSSTWRTLSIAGLSLRGSKRYAGFWQFLM
jgi:hypothetical protein